MGAPERLLTPDQAAAALGVPAEAIAVWKARRRVMPAGLIRGRNRAGLTPLYRLTELQPLADAYLERVAAAAAKASALEGDTPPVLPRLVRDDLL